MAVVMVALTPMAVAMALQMAVVIQMVIVMVGRKELMMV